MEGDYNGDASSMVAFLNGQIATCDASIAVAFHLHESTEYRHSD